jgi:hypothetical protein
MTDMYKPLKDHGQTPGQHQDNQPNSSPHTTRALLAGAIGGIVSAAAYLIYSRLPDEQRDRLHAQARTLLETRVNELRSRFNL